MVIGLLDLQKYTYSSYRFSDLSDQSMHLKGEILIWFLIQQLNSTPGWTKRKENYL